MDTLRRRRCFTEPETLLLMLQLIGACNYLHVHQVIHRDFGNPGVRRRRFGGRRTIVRYRQRLSFEVDIRSIGVPLCALVVGRPPFQTKEVKVIHKRIRDNESEFPIERPVLCSAQPHPSHPRPRSIPTPHTPRDCRRIILRIGPVPAFIPTSAPHAPRLSPHHSQRKQREPRTPSKECRTWSLGDSTPATAGKRSRCTRTLSSSGTRRRERREDRRC
ncbi:hypothetical protein BKA70DRAFT_1427018 [Coprinopsis sp. MPI-PUGE-AT-0042]|nr:hypothetical protein BKA70DRAFT_1427018 [Coprinopsis sp. MPI-PUGE-AT-0042]